MQLSRLAFALLLLLPTFVQSSIIPQSRTTRVTVSIALGDGSDRDWSPGDYGYHGTAVYRLYNSYANYPLGTEADHPFDSPVVTMERDSIQNQRWAILEVGSGEHIFINNGTGSLLCNDGVDGKALALRRPPHSADCRWKFDFDSYKSLPGTANFAVFSVQYPDLVLNINPGSWEPSTSFVLRSRQDPSGGYWAIANQLFFVQIMGSL